MAGRKVEFIDELNKEIEKGNEQKADTTKDVEQGKNDTPTPGEVPKLVIGKKVKKNTKKSFPVYMDEDRVKQIDKISAKSGHTRNELINMFVEFALNNLEIK